MTGAIDSMRQVHAALDDALAGSSIGGSPAELLELMRVVESARRRLAALDARVIAALESNHTAGECGRPSTADLLTCELRVAPAEAKARVAGAHDLGPRTTLTGEPLRPLLPATSDALALGALTIAHARVITECLDRVPSTYDAGAVASVEEALVAAAHLQHPGRLRRFAAALIDRLDPDGRAPRDELIERHRALSLGRHDDGTGALTGRLTPEVTAAFEAVLDALAAPAPSTDGEPDPRSAAQRRHDAFAELLQRVLRSGSLPPSGGAPVTIVVTTTDEQLGSESGVGSTTRGDQVRLRDLLCWGEAQLVPIVLGPRGEVMGFGRTRRLASRGQRIALTARDGGCSFPECERPAAWCEAHHVVPWDRGGSTDLDNLTLVCRFHHREFERRGWAVRTTGGRPEWIPPPWLDPAQRPRRNTVHHPPEIAFGDTGPPAHAA